MNYGKEEKGAGYNGVGKSASLKDGMTCAQSVGGVGRMSDNERARPAPDMHLLRRRTPRGRNCVYSAQDNTEVAYDSLRFLL